MSEPAEYRAWQAQQEAAKLLDRLHRQSDGCAVCYQSWAREQEELTEQLYRERDRTRALRDALEAVAYYDTEKQCWAVRAPISGTCFEVSHHSQLAKLLALALPLAAVPPPAPGEG